MSPPLGHVDVAVVGAGIVGLAHAYDAARRGLRVAVVERDELAVGASVRNFGHGILSGLAGEPAHARALIARERWLELGRDAGFATTTAGTLMLVRHPDELAAITAFAARHPETARLVAPEDAAELAPVPTEGVLGALHAPGDIRVDSERAVGAIAAHLEVDYGAALHWGTAVLEVQEGFISTTRGELRADHIVVCPGPDLQSLCADTFAARAGLTRCKLQMLELEPPHGRRYDPALITGLSLLRYPGFAAVPETAAVRERLHRDRPELMEHGIHLIVTQRPGGGLIVGDTHAYGTPAPWADERLDALLLEEARTLLGERELRVRRRWTGVYPTAPGEPFLVAAPAPGVRVVSVVSGIGMTTALGLAPEVMDGLLGVPSAPADRVVSAGRA